MDASVVEHVRADIHDNKEGEVKKWERLRDAANIATKQRNIF